MAVHQRGTRRVMDCGTANFTDFETCNRDLGRICGAYRILSDRWWDFRGRIANRTIGSLDIADVRFSHGVVIKDKKRDDRYLGDCYFLVLQAAGSALMRQRGAEADLRAGDCTLIDSRFQSTFEVGPDFHQYSFHLPADLVRKQFGNRPVPLAQTIRGNKGAGGVLSDTLMSVLRHGATLEGVDLTQMTVRLLGNAVGEPEERSEPLAVDRQLLDVREISEYIDAQIHRADLSPKAIADYFNVSLRQLYRISESAGCTPAALIWQRRLFHARRLLKESARGISITEIAMRCGFKDGAHFSRAYRKTFGEAPKATRHCRQPSVTRVLADRRDSANA